MAASVSPSVAGSSHKIGTGVAPLRAGEGRSFLWRRLHSLSGIFPVGVFLIEHFFSNAFATNGPKAYGDQVRFLTSLPFLIWIEISFIYIPILYHAVYGLYIWYRGESNVRDYPWTGNWLYTAQRWTGVVAFAYMAYHTIEMRWTGVHLVGNAAASFGKVQQAFQDPWVVGVYVIGIVAASWHFAYGLWLFAAKWGITVGEQARRRFGYVCFAVAVLFIAVGLITVRAFFQWPLQPLHTTALTETITVP